jgi:hypothetical protein
MLFIAPKEDFESIFAFLNLSLGGFQAYSPDFKGLGESECLVGTGQAGCLPVLLTSIWLADL